MATLEDFKPSYPLRLFNVCEYDRMREVGILQDDDHVELIDGVIIEHDTAGVHRRRFSVDEYYRMAEVGILRADERVELTDGEIVQMSAIGIRNATCVKRLSAYLYAFAGKKVTVSVQDPVRLNDAWEPEPDLAVLRYREDFYAEAHPTSADVLLLIEVSDSSLDYDRTTKLPQYARSRIPEVWIIDLSAAAIEIYSRPEGGAYRDVRRCVQGDEITSATVAGLTLRVEQILGEHREGA